VDIKELRRRLDSLCESLKHEDGKLLSARLKGLISVFPFNEYEYTLVFLMDKRIITFEDYENLRAAYVSTNKYLDLFELAPRIFGEIWGQEHILDLDRRFQKPSKDVDPKYEGQYDLAIEKVKVEVKAARAINTKMRGSLVSKALHFKSADPFWMNFQQIKPNASDAFIFIGVWVDQIAYWVLSRDEVKENPYLSHQHRGGIEYQIGVTHKNLDSFDEYKVKPSNLADKVIQKGKRR